MESFQHLQNGKVSMNISFDTILNLRGQWERLVSTGRGFNLEDYNGTIDNLYYFLDEGAKKNRFRKNCPEAIKIAKQIVEYYENEKNNLPSVYGKTV